MSEVGFELRIVAACIWVLVAFGCAGTAAADDWQWPPSMKVAGFSIAGISGSVRPDGSGAASGTIQIPGMGNPAVALTRSTSGEISGTLNMTTKPAGVEMQGAYMLDNSGLRGKCTVKTTPRQVVDASVSINANGQGSASGIVQLAGLNVPAKLTFSGNSCSLNGTAPTHAEADTPLASYDFNGTLTLAVSGSKLVITADGTVRRTGKLANQMTTHGVSDVSVDPGDGQGKVNVGGVNIVFDFFN